MHVRGAIRFGKELAIFAELPYSEAGIFLLEASLADLAVTALVCDPTGRGLPAVVRLSWPGQVLPLGTAQVDLLAPRRASLGGCEVCSWRFAAVCIHLQADLTYAEGAGASGHGASGYPPRCFAVLEDEAVARGTPVVLSALTRLLAAHGLGPSWSTLRTLGAAPAAGGAAREFVSTHAQVRLVRELWCRTRTATSPGSLPHALRQFVAVYAFPCDFVRLPAMGPG
jgi:hypothetical protein